MSAKTGTPIGESSGQGSMNEHHISHDSQAGHTTTTNLESGNLDRRQHDGPHKVEADRVLHNRDKGLENAKSGEAVNTRLENQNLDSNKKDGSTNAGDGRMHANKDSGKKSYASFFKDNRVPSHASMLNFFDPPDGEVVIGIDEIDSVEDTHGFCLVGYVMGPRPNPFAVLNFIKGWGGSPTFLFMDNGWIKFRFASEGDRDKVLNGGPYMIMGRQLFLKIMPSCFLYSKEEMELIPTWVQIFGLPKECWTPIALGRVASVVGKPIHTDMLTISKRGATYARVLVEMDVKKPRVWEYSVRLPTGKSTVARFKYEADAKYCGKCNSVGHSIEMCGVENRTRQHKYRPNNQSRGEDKGKAMEINENERVLGKHKTEPEQSGTKTNEMHVQGETKQQNLEVQQPKRDLGKGIEMDVNVQDAGQPRDGLTDEELSAFDENVSIGFFTEGYDLDSEDIEGMISRVEIRDKEEWKTVARKTKKHKKKKKTKTGVTEMNVDGGESSLNTEMIPIDLETNLPVKGQGRRYFKKKPSEVRPPDTASRCP